MVKVSGNLQFEGGRVYFTVGKVEEGSSVPPRTFDCSRWFTFKSYGSSFYNRLASFCFLRSLILAICQLTLCGKQCVG